MNKIIKNKSMFADFLLLMVALIWGAGFIAVKIALDSVDTLYILSFRFLGSGIILGIIFFKRAIRLDKSEVKAAALIGILLFLGQGLQTVGLKYTSAGKQGFIFAAYTIMVPFLSWIVNRVRPSNRSFIAGFLTLFGIGVISLNSQLTLGIGDTFTIISAVLFALMIVLTNKFAKDTDPISLTIIQMLVAGVLSLPSAVVFSPPIKNIQSITVWCILYVVLINTTLAYLLQNIATRYTTDTRVSIIISLEAFFGCLFAVLLINESVNIRLIIGGLMIFGAILLTNKKNKS